MKKIFLIASFLFTSLLFTDCNNATVSKIHQAGLSVKFDNDHRMEYIMPTPEWLSNRLGAYTSKVWPKSKRTFYVRWADGDQDIWDKTLSDWNLGITSKVGIKFIVTTDYTVADFNISFTQNNQSWSYLGTDCPYVAHTGQVTMNLGWQIRYRNNEGGERFGTCNHEMTHALGYTHTLQSPLIPGNLCWNKEVVYAAYAKMGWDSKMVDSQIFTIYTTSQVNDDIFDPKSLMCYYVLQGWATDCKGNPLVIGRNNAYSDIDNARLIRDFKPIDNGGGSGSGSDGGLITNTGTNIALGKPVTLSSQYSSFEGSRATDGNISTWFHCNYEINPSATVSFGKDFLIDQIDIVNRGECPGCVGRLQSFKIYDAQGKELVSYSKVLGNGEGKSFKVSDNTSSIKVVADMTNVTNGKYFHLAEIRAFTGGVKQCVEIDTVYRVLRDSMGKVCR